MAKIADKYYKVNPWRIIEEGFQESHGRVSESIFSIANEYMGVRGYFDEGYSGDKLVGSYINGVYEEKEVEHVAYFNGFATRFTFMVNTVDWLYTRINIDGEYLDIAKCKTSDFKRELNMKDGTLTRSYIWETKTGKKVQIKFIRFVSMIKPNFGFQKVIMKPLNFSGEVQIISGLDFTPIYELENKNLWDSVKSDINTEISAIQCKTQKSGQQVFSSFKLHIDKSIKYHNEESEKFIGKKFKLNLVENNETSFEKVVCNYASKDNKSKEEDIWQNGMCLMNENGNYSFDIAYEENKAYWEEIWNKLDIVIEGDEENQQGVRFCIFNLHQTYHGNDSNLNIGAKGLTGEFYFGWTWWDTETYCLPFYLFNNPKAAKSLLEYRYNTLPQAIERAKELDCVGACYPMGTIDGTESCTTWQHGNLEIHVSAAIPYGIWHYMRICEDKDFLYDKGIEMLIQVSRYFASRGEWSQLTGEYGFYGVMGPDEFHMMVNNNTYTNWMAKKTFEYTLEVIEEMRQLKPEKLNSLLEKIGVTEKECDDWKVKAEKMRISADEKTGIFEQHDGYFDLPHIDVKAIPHTQFPIYKNWAYDRIFRYDMTKQPDVLLFMFFFSQQFNLEEKRNNYEYYEPRCSHESSLSPAIHSILAAELGKNDEAYEFVKHASRLDLDNYNRNTHEGLHITSMAATWMNMIYGFGGMRSDGECLVFKPSIPKSWDAYSYRVLYQDTILSVRVDKERVTLKCIGDKVIKVKVYNEEYLIDKEGKMIIIPR